MNDVVLEAKKINKYFYDPVEFRVLKDISFAVEKGEFISVTGKSGCGKSTLLYILSTMDTAYEGGLFIDQESTAGMSEPQLAKIRNKKIGFVFQFHYLLNEFSVLKNIMLPGLKLNELHEKEVEYNAMEILKLLGMEKFAGKKANRLSGGEKQRVAIARAMINSPLIIMGDEPTGNLDKKNGEIVFDTFQRLTSEKKQTLLIVTHDQGFAENTNRIIEMEDGKIINGE